MPLSYSADTPNLAEVLATAPDVVGLAARLGEVCIADLVDLGLAARQQGAPNLLCRMERAVLAVPWAWWLDPARATNGFAGLMIEAPAFAKDASSGGAAGRLPHLALLRALCKGVLPAAEDLETGTRVLRRGAPVRLCRRPMTGFQPGGTPSPSNLDLGSVLKRTGYRLYGGPTSVPVEVVLDYSESDSLELATWDASTQRVPCISSVHPHADFATDQRFVPLEGNRFFDVGPREPGATAVLNQLTTAAEAGARIAVLPELCLAAPDALDSHVAASDATFPDLIAAGSAHARVLDAEATDGTAWVNEGTLYLFGTPVLRYRKLHPFVFTVKSAYEDGTTGSTRWTEALQHGRSEIRILCSPRTRLAVVICADLNDGDIPTLLEQAGVNLLLVPSLTPKTGAFYGAISQLASRGQGVSVVVNGAHPDATDTTFHVMLAAPRSSDQVHEEPAPAQGRRAVGVIDVHANPLSGAVRWL